MFFVPIHTKIMFNLNLYKEKLTTDIYGKSIEYYPKLDSTNTKARELIYKKIKNGTVVITDNQTEGRGRQSNKWISIPQKSLTFSIILFPEALPNQINIYSLIAGLAISDCLIEYDIPTQLKWPNDILINNKKVGGILCESKISRGAVKSLVIGVGLNVNETIGEFPKDLCKIVTSLMIEMGEQYSKEILLAKIINYFEKRINQIDDLDLHFMDWENRCVHINKTISFFDGINYFQGTFKGLSSTGQATITIDDRDFKFDSGETSQIDFK